MLRFSQPKGHPHCAVQRALQPILLLLFRTKVTQHQNSWHIAHDGAFVLQVIVQSKALRCQIFADNRHGQIGAILPAKFFGKRIAQMASGIGAAAHFTQKLFPVFAWQTLIIPIRARMFAAVVKEAIVVVLLLKGFNFFVDEVVQDHQIIFDILRNVEIHNASNKF